MKSRTIYTVGRYGIPMEEFKWDGTKIRIKDTKEASIYSQICKKCPYFACQEGLYHLTLTVDGKLKMCRHRPDISVNLTRKNNAEIKKAVWNFLSDHYFLSERMFTQKQVFLGHFGTNDAHR